MSYNPNVHGAGANRNGRRQRRLDPRAGYKASDIIARHGPRAATIDDVRNKINTPRGWKVLVHKGNFFEMVYELICARNATGIVKHDYFDRALRVLGGEIFLTISSEVVHLRAGDSYAISAGVEYQLATSGNYDAEVIFCQGPEYEETLIQVTEPQAVNVTGHLPLPKDVSDFPYQQVSRERAMQQAQMEQAKREHREQLRKQEANRSQSVQENEGANPQAREAVVRAPGRAPTAGQQVQGVNPRPVGASGFGEG